MRKSYKKHYALFSKTGFTKALREQAQQQQFLLFEGAELRRVMES